MNRIITVSFSRKYPSDKKFKTVDIGIQEEFEVVLPGCSEDLISKLEEINAKLAKDPKNEKYLNLKGELEAQIKQEKMEIGRIWQEEVNKGFMRVKSMIQVQEDQLTEQGIISKGEPRDE